MTFPYKILILLGLTLLGALLFVLDPIGFATFDFSGESLLGLTFGTIVLLAAPAVIAAIIAVAIIFLISNIPFKKAFISISYTFLSAIILLLYLTNTSSYKSQQIYLKKAVEHIEVLNNVETQLVWQISNYKLLADEERYYGKLTGQNGYGAYSHLLYSYFHHLSQNHKTLADESTLVLGNAILAQDLLTEAEKAQEAGSFIDFSIKMEKLKKATWDIKSGMEKIYNNFNLMEYPTKKEMFSPKFYTVLKQKELINTERMLFEEMEADLQAQLKAYPTQMHDVTAFNLYNWVHYTINLIVFLITVILFYWHRRVE